MSTQPALLGILSNVLAEVFDIGTSPNALGEADAVETLLAERGYAFERIDDRSLRREALDAAVRSARGDEDDSALAARAEVLFGFLRGDSASPVVEARQAPAALHDAFERAWKTLREDVSGLRVLEGEDGDEEVLELLRQLSDEDLRRITFVAHVVSTLASSVRARR